MEKKYNGNVKAFVKIYCHVKELYEMLWINHFVFVIAVFDSFDYEFIKKTFLIYQQIPILK